MIPDRHQPLGLDATLSHFFLAQQVEGNMARSRNGRHIASGKAVFQTVALAEADFGQRAVIETILPGRLAKGRQ